MRPEARINLICCSYCYTTALPSISNNIETLCTTGVKEKTSGMENKSFIFVPLSLLFYHSYVSSGPHPASTTTAKGTLTSFRPKEPQLSLSSPPFLHIEYKKKKKKEMLSKSYCSTVYTSASSKVLIVTFFIPPFFFRESKHRIIPYITKHVILILLSFHAFKKPPPPTPPHFAFFNLKNKRVDIKRTKFSFPSVYKLSFPMLQ